MKVRGFHSKRKRQRKKAVRRMAFSIRNAIADVFKRSNPIRKEDVIAGMTKVLMDHLPPPPPAESVIQNVRRDPDDPHKILFDVPTRYAHLFPGLRPLEEGS